MLKSKFEIGKKYELSAKTRYVVVDRTETTVTLAELIQGKEYILKPFSVKNNGEDECVTLDRWDKQHDCYYELFSYQTVELAETILMGR